MKFYIICISMDIEIQDIEDIVNIEDINRNIPYSKISMLSFVYI